VASYLIGKWVICLNNIKVLIEELFEDKVFYKTLFKIAMPIVIQNFIASFLNMVDTVMIGRVGEIEIAAVGIANQYFFLFIIIIMSIYSGCGIFISQFWGKRDVKNIRRVLGVGLISGIIGTLAFMAAAIAVPDKIIAIFNTDPRVIDLGARYLRIVSFGYIFTAVSICYSFAMRSIGETVVPMVFSAIALLCNTFFNYTFIFGHFGSPVMGVEGAAIATLIARIVETTLLLIYIYSKGGVLAASIREMADVTFEFVSKVYRTIVPVMLNEACWGLGFTIYSVAYGRIGPQAIAAVQICSTIQHLFMAGIFGMADSAAVMIGNRIGANEEEMSVDYANRFSILGVMSGITLGVFLWLTAAYMLKMFNVSETVLHDSLMILYITSLILPVRVFNIILIVGIFRGGGDAKMAFFIEALTMWGIGVPLSFIGALYFKFPVYYVIGLLTAEEITKSILGLMRLRSRKWVRNVTHNMA